MEERMGLTNMDAVPIWPLLLLAIPVALFLVALVLLLILANVP